MPTPNSPMGRRRHASRGRNGTGYQRPETGDRLGYVARRHDPGRPPSPYRLDRATAMTIEGSCPDCGRPAHQVLAGNFWERAEGWHHDSRADLATCWAGKAAYETGCI